MFCFMKLAYCFYWWHDRLIEYVTRCYYRLNLDPNSQLVIALNYLLAQCTMIDRTTVYTSLFCALVANCSPNKNTSDKSHLNQRNTT